MDEYVMGGTAFMNAGLRGRVWEYGECCAFVIFGTLLL